MNDVLNFVIQLKWYDFLDLLIVAVVLYRILLWLKGTTGIQLLRGILLLLFIYIGAKQLNLHTINWLMEKFITVILVLIIIIFQPELRRALERLGRGKFFSRFAVSNLEGKSGIIVRKVINAVMSLSENKIGGIIIIERETGLNDVVSSGIRIDAKISSELLTSIFYPKTTLHDGALVIQEDRISAAACLLPLSESKLIDRRLGTRHRAAIGISEQSDAFVIVISERSGTISAAENGMLTRFLTKEMLEEKLFAIYKKEPSKLEVLPWFKTKTKEEPTK